MKLRATAVKEIKTENIENEQSKKIQMDIEDVGGDKIRKVGTMTMDNFHFGFEVGDSFHLELTKWGGKNVEEADGPIEKEEKAEALATA